MRSCIFRFTGFAPFPASQFEKQNPNMEVEREPTPPALDASQARAMVARWTRRWCPIKSMPFPPAITCQLKASHSSSDFVAMFDTLVVYVSPGGLRQRPIDAASNVQEALLLWYALSCCRGFSFQENLDFWLDALAIKLSGPRRKFTGTANPTIVPVASRPFPRVVLFWDSGDQAHNRRQDDEIEQFEWRALEVFQEPFVGGSGDFRYDFERLKPFLPSNHQLVLPCVLRIRFGKHPTTTKKLTDAILARVRKWEEDNQEEKVVTGIRLSGIEFIGRRSSEHGCIGLQVQDFDTLVSFCDSLPSRIGIDMRFPMEEPKSILVPRDGLGQERIDSTFRRLIGFHGSAFAGRMRVLDLLHAFPTTRYTDGLMLDFETFCSLLPHAVSLEELRLQLTRSENLLWLAYAVFHPTASTRNLKTLVLGTKAGAKIDWKVLDEYIRRKARPTALVEKHIDWCNVDQYWKGEQPEPDEIVPLVSRTAILSRPTRMFELKRSLTVATLPKGTIVEICDVRPGFHQRHIFNASKTPSTVIIAPGYGMGRINTSNLKEAKISTVELEEPQPRSCITTLHLGSLSLSPEDLAIIVRAFGPSLKHLRGRTLHPPTLLVASRFGGFALSELESIDCIHFTSQMTPLDFSTLKSLRSIGLCCLESEMDAAFGVLSSFHGLKSVRIQIRADSVESTKKQVAFQVQELLRRTRSLRYVNVELHVEEVHDDEPPVDVGDSNFGLWRHKLSFLSAVQHVHDRHDDPLHGSLGQLDSSVLRRVWDFSGHSVEHVACTLQPAAGYGLAKGPHNMQTKLDAWEDDRACHD